MSTENELYTNYSESHQFRGWVYNKKAGMWTVDPSGQEWQLSSSGWVKVDGLSENGEDQNFRPYTSFFKEDRPSESNSINGNENIEEVKLRIGPIGDGPSGPEQTLRWPSDVIHSKTDYVFFEFGKYIPPFSKDINDLRTRSGQALEDAGFIVDDDQQIINSLNNKGDTKLGDIIRDNATNAAGRGFYNAANLDITGRQNIMLPMPQDLSNELNQQWQGKQFTATGRAAVAAMAAANFSLASEVVANVTGNAKALQTALTASVLNNIPGVGGNIDFNDVSGSTRGIVINPNAELLYDSPEMREVGMIFKLVPQNKDESIIIKNIIRTFRAASMPRWGGNGLGAELISGNKEISAFNKDGSRKTAAGDAFDIGSEDNWIQVPDLCKFTFMSGGEHNPYIIQFKPCAISGVEVNYTPEGTYSTYSDGAPAAVELRLNFMETKLVFADEVGIGF